MFLSVHYSVGNFKTLRCTSGFFLVGMNTCTHTGLSLHVQSPWTKRKGSVTRDALRKTWNNSWVWWLRLNSSICCLYFIVEKKRNVIQIRVDALSEHGVGPRQSRSNGASVTVYLGNVPGTPHLCAHHSCLSAEMCQLSITDKKRCCCNFYISQPWLSTVVFYNRCIGSSRSSTLSPSVPRLCEESCGERTSCHALQTSDHFRSCSHSGMSCHVAHNTCFQIQNTSMIKPEGGGFTYVIANWKRYL